GWLNSSQSSVSLVAATYEYRSMKYSPKANAPSRVASSIAGSHVGGSTIVVGSGVGSPSGSLVGSSVGSASSVGPAVVVGGSDGSGGDPLHPDSSSSIARRPIASAPT